MDGIKGVLDGRPGETDTRLAAQLRVDRLRQRVETGELDATRLQERLSAAFGETADDIVGEDGSLDTETPPELITTSDCAMADLRVRSTVRRSSARATTSRLE